MPYISKHPKSPYWSAWFTDENGQRTSRSTKQSDKREALKTAIGYEEDAKAAREGTLTASHVLRVYNKFLAKSGQKITAESVEVFAKRWLTGKRGTRSARTADTYEPVINGFLASLGSKARAPLTAIIPADVEAHRDKLTAAGRKPPTVRNYLKIISTLFNAAHRQGLIESNPVLAVEFNDAPQQEREPFTPDEIKTLLAHADDEWKTAILFGADAGMRLGDAVGTDWEAIDLEKRLTVFTPQKTKRKGRIVTVPMTERLCEHLMKLAGDSGGFLCPTLAKMGSGGCSGLSGHFKALMERAGIVNRVLAEGKGKGRTQSAKSFHSLRHSFNSALMNAGVDEKIRMDLSGHTTARMNRQYSHSEMASLKAAIKKTESSSQSGKHDSK